MRLAFAGFAHSHPFTDAGVAGELGVSELHGWDGGEPARFAAATGSVLVHPDTRSEDVGAVLACATEAAAPARG
ncbi:hypothetical protein [Embleya sp. AB8]|uniref:hypothetical protein n=1 Tax=Embleya sp. AB8 TaxID=3156304 RepID=UPI003C791DC6